MSFWREGSGRTEQCYTLLSAMKIIFTCTPKENPSESIHEHVPDCTIQTHKFILNYCILQMYSRSSSKQFYSSLHSAHTLHTKHAFVQRVYHRARCGHHVGIFCSILCSCFKDVKHLSTVCTMHFPVQNFKYAYLWNPGRLAKIC